ncbi:MAG: DinB family protein [Chloroflexi bacterium]|nr:DinB family protein [Chloroflexota bacterium]
MTLTLLLDLDDTLLNTNLESFVPAYFQSLAKELASQVPPEKMLPALVSGTNLMNQSEDFTQTLEEIFNHEFFLRLGISRDALTPVIEHYYDVIFPTLSGLTSPKPAAKPFVEWAFSRGYRIAIATDPLLPRKATYERLRWAGFAPEQFELVSTFDHFHFSKTHPAYYAEILGRLGWPETPILMVGNDIDRDILPAQKLGLATFHISEQPELASAQVSAGSGSLSDVKGWLDSVGESALLPSFKSVDSVLAILAATPASLNGLLNKIDALTWSHSATAGDWSLTELLCHLRDTEREVHQMQIRLFSEQDEPFIPRPDTSVWASRRDYRHENGEKVLQEFNTARLETLNILKNISVEDWGKKARHAIFGPTNFLEVAGFIADHDRMHVQQTWGILKKMQNFAVSSSRN